MRLQGCLECLSHHISGSEKQIDELRGAPFFCCRWMCLFKCFHINKLQFSRVERYRVEEALSLLRKVPRVFGQRRSLSHQSHYTSNTSPNRHRVIIRGRSATDQECELAIQQSQGDRTCLLALCRAGARSDQPRGAAGRPVVGAGEGFAARSRMKYLLRLGLDGIIIGGMIAVNRGCIGAAGAQ